MFGIFPIQAWLYLIECMWLALSVSVYILLWQARPGFPWKRRFVAAWLWPIGFCVFVKCLFNPKHLGMYHNYK